MNVRGGKSAREFFTMHPHHMQTVVILAALFGNGQLTTSQVGEKVAQVEQAVKELRDDARDHERRIAALERQQ